MTIWSKEFWSKGVWPPGYWAMDGEAQDGAGAWWWPDHLLRAFGILPSEEVPEPIAVVTPEPVTGSAIVVFPRVQVRGIGTVELPLFEGTGNAVAAAISAEAQGARGEVGTAKAQLGSFTGAGQGTYTPFPNVGAGNAVIPSIGIGHAQAQAGLSGQAHGLLLALQIEGVAEYAACTEQELLELTSLAVGAYRQFKAIDVQVPPDITEEELLVIIAASREYIHRARL